MAFPNHNNNNNNDNNVDIQEMKFVMSSDAKPRLKWTRELHHRFVKAVDRLGGAEKATPKSLMRMMGIDGLTLYHLKSHLQKYRMGNTQQVVQTYRRVKEEDYEEKKTSCLTIKNCDGDKEPIIGSLNITRALHMKMEIQRKLHEQIEVQRHLQLRIEAQGKYFQSILGKAQETIDQYSSCSIKVEQAKVQLSQLLSMVNSDNCPNSSLPVLTESEEGTMSMLPESSIDHENYNQESENSEKGLQWMNSLVEMHRVENGGCKRKMSEISIDDDEINHVERSASKELRLLEKIDLN